ncbi:hypothetical protein ES703_08136 [subsurface metagenome]
MQAPLSGFLAFILLVTGGLGAFFDAAFDAASELINISLVHPGEQTAQILPPDTDGYATINLRPGLGQLEKVRDILSHWLDNPAIDSESQEALSQFESESGINIAADILPWIGPEVVLGTCFDPEYMTKTGGEPIFVLIIGTLDRAQSDAFIFNKLFPYLAKGGWTPAGPTDSYRGIDTLYDFEDNFFLAFTDDYIIWSQVQSRFEAILDLYLDGGPSLATTGNFTAAQAKLPAERMAMSYVNIGHMIDGISAAERPEDLAGFNVIRSFLPSFAASSAYFVDDAIRTDYYLPSPINPFVLAAVVIPNIGRFIGRGESEAIATEASNVQAAVQAMMVDAAGTVTQVTTGYPSAYPTIGENLLNSANLTPGNALGFFSERDLKSWWESVKPTVAEQWPEFKKATGDPNLPDSLEEMLAWLKDELGIDMEEDVLAWMNGEISAAIMPFTGEIPELLMMVEVDNPAQVADNITAIVNEINTIIRWQGGDELELVPITIEGVPATKIQCTGDPHPIPSACYAFLDVDTSHYLVGSLTESGLSAAIDALNNPGHSLAQNAGYQSMLTSLPQNKRSFSYIDVQQAISFIGPMLKPARAPMPMAEPEEPTKPQFFSESVREDGGEATSILVAVLAAVVLPNVGRFIGQGEADVVQELAELLPAFVAPLHSLGMSETTVDSTGMSGTVMLRVQEVDSGVYLRPAQVQRKIGDSFSVNVCLDEVWADNVSDLRSAEFHLAFNPNQIEVLDADNITPGIQITPVLPEGIGDNYSITINSADNTAGTICYAITLGTAVQLIVPGATIATIDFHCKAPGVGNIVFLNPNVAEPPVILTDSTATPIPVIWQGSVVRQYWLPTIDEALAMPQTLSLLGMFRGEVGPSWTNFVVEANPNWELGGVGIEHVTVDLRSLLLQILPPPLVINLRSDMPPFDDVRVREAMSIALDITTILASPAGGYAGILLNPREGLPRYYDPERAKQLLAEAGYPDGFKTHMLVIEPYVGLASILRDYWLKIGVDCEIRVVGIYELFDKSASKTYEQMLCGPQGWQMMGRDKVESWEHWLSELKNRKLWRESERVYRYHFNLWELIGHLPWFLGENNAEGVMDRLTLGDFSLPVIVTDRWGNEVSSSLDLTIVDTMQPLTKGWNLVSFPVRLDDAFTTWEDIFNLGDGLRCSAALRYDSATGQWVTIAPDYRLKPLEAIYVYAFRNDQIGAIFARNPTSPPMRQLEADWNLVGLATSPADWDSMPVDEAMVSVEQDINGLRGYSIVVSPGQQVNYGEDYRYWDSEGRGYHFGGYSWNFQPNPWIYTVGSNDIKDMLVGGGYWVFMERPDILAGFSTTPVTVPWQQVEEPGHDLWSVPRYDWEPVARTLFEKYSIGGYTKIYLKYSGDVSPSRVVQFYQERMPEFKWKLTEWEGFEDSATLCFHKELEQANLDCQIDVLGGDGIYILFECHEPGVDRWDVPRFDWAPALMTSHNHYTDDRGTHTEIKYQGPFDHYEVFEFYRERMGQHPYYWEFKGGECYPDNAWLNFHRTNKEGRPYWCFIRAEEGVIQIWHHKSEPVEEPRYGGVFTMGWDKEPQYFDEALFGIVRAPTLHLTNEELLMGDWAKGPAGSLAGPGQASWRYPGFATPHTLAGSLARSWEITDNQTTITFHIRKGVHFHDKPPTNGREMNANDVVFSLKRLWETPTSYHYRVYPWQGYFEALDGEPWIKATDNWTVEIKALPGKLGRVYEIAGDYSKIVPPEVVAASGNMSDWRDACGTGPFMLTDYVEGSSANFTRSPGYWMKDPLRLGNQLPYLDGVNYLFIPDKSTRLAALRTGQIDWLNGRQGPIQWQDAQSLMSTNPELQHLRHLPAMTMALFMRTDNQSLPFYDIRVRRALAMAIDQQEIKNEFYGGNAEILTSPIAPVSDFKDMYTPLGELPQSTRELYGYNPEQAKQLLAEAGYPEGFRTKVVCTTDQVDMASIVKAYWAEIGVDLIIDVKEKGAHMSIGDNKTYDHMYMRNMGASMPFRGSYYRPGSPSNYSLIDDSYINQEMEKIEDAYFDEPERRQLMKELTPYILEQCYIIQMPEPYVYTFWQPWVRGYHGEFSVGMMNFDFSKYIWIDQELKEEMTGGG